VSRIFISGPMGSGKSSLARVVAVQTGLPAFDLDAEVEARTGQSVSELFAGRGEAAFRQYEADALRALISEHQSGVFALGGGTVTDDGLRRELLRQGVVVSLWASPGELARRVGGGEGRPLLSGQDVALRLTGLIAARAAAYAECHAALDTEGRSPDELAALVCELAVASPIVVPLGTRTYRVEVGSGIRARLPERLAVHARSPRVLLVSDERVAAHWLLPIGKLLRDAGRQVIEVVLPAGEEHKTLRSVEQIWEAGLVGGIDRGGAVVALGGGVIGDLAGFAASTLLRGIAVLQLPTTLLAMVDSSVGGKTGFDTPQGKNLIGSFHQPSAVLCDVDMLGTLPVEERRAGLAEVVKSAWIESEAAVAELERDAPGLVAGERDATLRAIAMSIGMKARIVSEDERESELRAVLNLGHTVGHAIEASMGYQGMRHGEAVALGMVAALGVSVRLGHARATDASRAVALLNAMGLPTDVGRYLHERVLSFIAADKKRTSDKITLVVPGQPGCVTLRSTPLSELLALLTGVEA
jgi:shikimate kinase / 3-dehydroquinate synthase